VVSRIGHARRTPDFERDRDDKRREGNPGERRVPELGEAEDEEQTRQQRKPRRPQIAGR
jgi:hypothetical protein